MLLIAYAQDCSVVFCMKPFMSKSLVPTFVMIPCLEKTKISIKPKAISYRFFCINIRPFQGIDIEGLPSL